MSVRTWFPLALLFVCHATGEAGDFFDRYFEARVKQIESASERLPATKEEYLTRQQEKRRELADMLGLDPMPARSPLNATVTGQFEHEGIIVENLHYQPMPGFYVTANLYRPKQSEKPLPAVLYLCGHSDKQKDGVSYGNKAGYEHHGVWYAKNGFVCLIIDTVQLGEIRGEHHGLHRLGKWWWISRGYTPAGVEAWSGIRGLDYLESRPEVDAKRMGVTGRSGGGAYSWWVAALDERIACAAPTAGITTLRDHIVEGCVSGHCDCMYMANNRRWDYPDVSSLVAPRPLLIANTDKDSIFPIEGVYQLFRNTREAYMLLGAEKNLGIHIAEGEHQDLQPLHAGEFHWMLRHLQNQPAAPPFDGAAPRTIPMEKLRVFTSLPTDERNTTIDKTFIPPADVGIPENQERWDQWKTSVLKTLSTEIFPMPEESITTRKLGGSSNGGITSTRFVLSSDHPDLTPDLDLHLLHREGTDPSQLDAIVLRIMDEEETAAFSDELKKQAFRDSAEILRSPATGFAFFSPRGIGATARAGTPKELIHFKRRFFLMGETLESNQVTDIRRCIAASNGLLKTRSGKLHLTARSTQGVNALYASVLEGGVSRLDLHALPSSHMEAAAPAYLNVMRHLDIPQVAAIASETSAVNLHDVPGEPWLFPRSVGERLQWSRSTSKGLTTDDAATR